MTGDVRLVVPKEVHPTKVTHDEMPAVRTYSTSRVPRPIVDEIKQIPQQRRGRSKSGVLAKIYRKSGGERQTRRNTNSRVPTEDTLGGSRYWTGMLDGNVASH